MELFPIMDVWDGNTFVVFGIHHAPVWWRADLVGSVGSFLVQIAVTFPCNTLVDHSVVHRLGIVALIQQTRSDKAVVEQRVCDQTARIVCLTVGIETQRVTVTVVDGAVINNVSFELVLVERFNIATVILVEVCELIVEEDGWGQIVRDPEAQGADGRVDVDGAVVVGNGLVGGTPLRSLRGGGGILEAARDIVGGDSGEGVGGIACAVLVFDGHLLNLRAGP